MTTSAMPKLILAFVTLIVGVVLIGTIATNTLAVTDKTPVINESYDISGAILAGSINVTDPDASHTMTNAPTTWKITDCPLTLISAIQNNGTGLTLTTDYTVVASTGVLTLVNSTAMIGVANSASNTTKISYTYCADDYMNLSWGRTLLNLIAGFFALALLGVSVGLFYSVAKDYGII